MAINLQKVTIEKSGDTHSIDLTKRDHSTKEIVINLNWSQEKKTKNGGFLSGLFGGNKDIDLDLGVFYELTDGSKNCIDGLQFSKGQGGPRDRKTRQGCYTYEPWIWHTGDDRGASAGSGENVIVNPQALDKIKRIIVYCFIYDGVARWAETNAVVTIKVPGNPDIEVQMGQQNDHKKFCAIAEILISPTAMQVKKLISFHNSHGDCDRMYNWGMKWAAGSK
ncbi:TerD family protein [Empedobacter falsenii]|uniref:TerD family protein n=1 Tax=Empedobacter TaxID=59734 RepID=UPI00056F4F7B|nr:MULTISPECIES: TerD family protein [Empedobacter]MDH0674245.1 TerD family protein [Empedobacter sp. GD03861]